MTGLIFGILGVGLTFAGGTFAMAGCLHANGIGNRAFMWVIAFVLLLIGRATLSEGLFSAVLAIGALGAGADHMRRVRGMN